MLTAAALLLAAQAPAADRPMLDAFRTVCDKVDDLAAMNAAAGAEGWQEIGGSADPRIDKLARIWREELGAHGEVSVASFRRQLGDRTLFLFTSRYVADSGFWGNGCRLYHFEADAPIDAGLLENWMTRAPTGRHDLGAAIGHKSLWEPGWRSGLTVEVSHVRQGSKFAETLGLSGNILVAQAIGGF